MQKVVVGEIEDVIEMVNNGRRGRENISVVVMNEQQARSLLVKGKENKALKEQLAHKGQEQLAMKVYMFVVNAILVAACIGGVHTEAMTPAFAWAIGLPCALVAILACLPKHEENEAVNEQ